MGLDMYLYARKYESVGSWEENYEEKKVGFYPEGLARFQESIEKRDFLSKQTMYQIGYWRKANAIHDWFVKYCADGVDNCEPVYVSVSRIKELRDLCNRVLENHDLAPKLLPTCEGFFFGTQDYDDWYFDNIQYTKELLDSVIELADEGEYDIMYEASW